MTDCHWETTAFGINTSFGQRIVIDTVVANWTILINDLPCTKLYAVKCILWW